MNFWRSGISIRALTVDDIPDGLRLCRASGWNQTARDWEQFLTASPRGALVATDRGAVVGTVATMPYGPFTWVSMVLVDPAARGRGIGTMLLHHGLALVPPGSIARLDATPQGEVVYRKLGFAGESTISRLFLDRPPARADRLTSADARVRPFTDADWPEVLDIDKRAFGASRVDLLRRFVAEAPDYARIATDGTRLLGFLIGRHGTMREHLGPLVANTTETAILLLDSCLASHPGRGVFIDVPDDRYTFHIALAERRFAIERRFLRMHRGEFVDPGGTPDVYAIAGPEFG